jgi:hypothetical protein
MADERNLIDLALGVASLDRVAETLGMAFEIVLRARIAVLTTS